MTDNSIIVYSPSGKAEKHTRANARDLVNGSGYSWHRGVPTTPASVAPFATVKPPEGPPPSQKVLDSVGGSASAAQAAAQGAATAQAAEAERIAKALAEQQALAAAATTAPADEEVVDYSAPPAVDATDLDDAPEAEADADAEVEAEADAPEVVEETAEEAPRRGRRRRTAE